MESDEGGILICAPSQLFLSVSNELKNCFNSMLSPRVQKKKDLYSFHPHMLPTHCGFIRLTNIPGFVTLTMTIFSLVSLAYPYSLVVCLLTTVTT